MKIGIIGAMDAEIEKFINLFNLKKDSTNNKNIYIGEYQGKNLIVALSGIGKVNSAAMTQFIIDNYNVDVIINSGCAGALTNKVGIMNVIISNYVTYHDFKPIRVMNYAVPDNGRINADEKLIRLAEKVIKEKSEIQYFIGPICSGDSFITNSNTRDQVYNETNALVVDMESTSIGHISKLNDVPFIAIRTVSDFADGVEDMETLAAYQSSVIVKEIIDNL